MASVQELILASQAQREESPLVGILKSLAGGVDAYQQSKSNAIQDLVRQTAIQKQQQEMQMQLAAEQRKAAQRSKDQADEQALKESFKSVGGTPPPVMPQQKLTKVRDEEGNVTTSTVYGNDDVIGMTPYQKENLEIQRKRLGLEESKLNQKAKSGEMATQEKKEIKQNEILRKYNTYEAAKSSLISGLSGSVTGPIMGRLPALTEGQQVAEGAVAQMAPVLKDIFRVSGEGTFTDRDQDLLLRMVATRANSPGAATKKIEAMDKIVKAKLGLSDPMSEDEINDLAKSVGVNVGDKDNGINWSDAEEQELRALEAEFGGR